VIPRAAVLSLVVTQFSRNDGDWVDVPVSYLSKARALCRQGMLVEGSVGRFKPSALGKLAAKDLDAAE